MDLKTKVINLKKFVNQKPKYIVLGLIGLLLLQLFVILLAIYLARFDYLDNNPIYEKLFEFTIVSTYLTPIALIVFGILRLLRGTSTDEEEIRQRRSVTLKYFAVSVSILLAFLIVFWRKQSSNFSSVSFELALAILFLSALLVVIVWYLAKYARDAKISELVNKAPSNYLISIIFFVFVLIGFVGISDNNINRSFWLFLTVSALLVGTGSVVLGYLGSPEDKSLTNEQTSNNEKEETATPFESVLSNSKTGNLELLFAKVESNSNKLEDLLNQSSFLPKKDGILAERTTLIRDRLMGELRDLTRRGNVNLTIGILTTIAAIGALFWGLIATQPAPNETEAAGLIKHYLPRVSFAIFIEVFSFFFLRLYKNSLEDIKYYHNELTNLDSKLLALEIADLNKLSDALTPILLGLLNTDRNFILKSGESTVELEKVRTEQLYMRALIDNISAKIPSLDTTKKY